MNQKDKQLLNELQFNFPVVKHPYKVIGDRLNYTEAQIIDKIKQLKDKGIVRRIGGVFESKMLKHSSALIAAKIPKDNLKKAALVISGYREVTHAYLRTHKYNLWFTVTSTSQRAVKTIADQIKKSAGIDELYILPAIRKFKIDTKFKL